MPERGVPTILIDGPNAGQFLYTEPGATAWRVVKPFGLPDWTPLLDLGAWVIQPTVYRFQSCTACLKVRNSPDPAYIQLRIGWSEGADPDEDAIRRYGRAALLDHPELMPAGTILWDADPAGDEPIRVLEQGDGPAPGCRDEFHLEPGTRLLCGTCPCGWRTELVESRRFEELRALTSAHGQAGMAALTEIIRRGIVSYAECVGTMGIVDQANRRAGDSADALRYAYSSTVRHQAEAAPALDWGDPLTAADADWPSQGGTCAHICGADPDHRCDARATTRLAYGLPSGGTRSMPLCAPCHASEIAAKEDAHV